MRGRADCRSSPVVQLLAYLSAVAAFIGLVAHFGLGHDPDLADPYRVNLILRTAVGLFVASRTCLFLPPWPVGPRLKRHWLDFLLLVAAALAWQAFPAHGRTIVFVLSVYILISTLASVFRSSSAALTLGFESPSTLGKLLVGAVTLAIAGGLLLALPVCWTGMHPFEIEQTYDGERAFRIGTHVLDCIFTATAALTGTGLTVHELEFEFTQSGLTIILILMQIGGLAVLAIGSAIGWRLRAMIGWGARSDDLSPNGIRRGIAVACLTALILEIIGAGALYFTSPINDADATIAVSNRLFDSVFHSVSAFCNVGLTVRGTGMFGRARTFQFAGILMPLMLLGSLGGPVILDVLRRWTGRLREPIPIATWVTLLVTLALIAEGTLVLVFTERTTDWQLGREIEGVPGHLRAATTVDATTDRATTDETTIDQKTIDEVTADETTINEAAIDEATTDDDRNPPAVTGETPRRSGSARQDSHPNPLAVTGETPRQQRERIRSMPASDCWTTTAALSIAARSGGMATARLDDDSITPAGRWLLINHMLLGGGLGGTAGGLRLVVVVLLILAILERFRRAPTVDEPRHQHARNMVFTAAAGVLASMLIMITITTFWLTYRQNAATDACLFEAVSATCNVGYSTGMTRTLATEDNTRGPLILRMSTRIILILAMLLGRTLPLAILLRCTRNLDSTASTLPEPSPHVAVPT